MKKVNVSNISGSTKAPFLKKTHTHYNDAIKETADSIVKSLYGSYSSGDVIILYGCEIADTVPGISTIDSGAIYYNGEVYLVDADSVLTTGSETLIWDIETTYVSGDPINYSNNTEYDTHQIDKFKLQAGTSGSGIANYDSATVKTLHKLYNKAEQSDVTDLQNNKADKAMTSWTNASIPGGGITGSVQYRKDSFGVVYLRGYVQLNLAGNTTPIVIVSSMGLFKPAVDMQVPVLIMDDSNSIHPTSRGYLQISSTSSEIGLAVDNDITTSNFVRLDGISFVDYTV